MAFQAVYVPIGVGTYHMETAGEYFRRSVDTLKALCPEVICPDSILLTTADAAKYLEPLHPDLVILQNVTFANAAYASEVLRRFQCPLVLWTLREPVIDGGRLRMNSLTGAYSAANAIHAFRKDGQFEYVFGMPDEDNVKAELGACLRAAQTLCDLRGLKMAAIGHTPQGFGFGRALDAEMMSNFGVTLDSIEARELINKAKTYTAEDCKAELDEARAALVGLDNTPEKNVIDFARLYKAYKEYINANGIGAIASRCWPDFFTEYGTPVCSVLSLLNANGIIASCEVDAYGALSMYIGRKLTGEAAFFGDPVSMDEKESTITYWHCGMAACSLARKDTGAQVGVHPNRKIGPVMDFGCAAKEGATLFRIGRKTDGTFRFFIAECDVLDKPKQFCGASVVVKTKSPADKVVFETIKGGWEPHYVVVYGSVASELEKLGHMVGAEIWRY